MYIRRHLDDIWFITQSITLMFLFIRYQNLFTKIYLEFKRVVKHRKFHKNVSNRVRYRSLSILFLYNQIESHMTQYLQTSPYHILHYGTWNKTVERYTEVFLTSRFSRSF